MFVLRRGWKNPEASRLGENREGAFNARPKMGQLDMQNSSDDEAVEAWARNYNAENFDLAWEALPEWARESHRDTARKAIGKTS
ncbi:hypothetical protein ACFC25_04345 [Pseudarthrobacter sp. NPDC055928]|uniref:hypothetical protein n=1 Tax=Pseudarthrobacter sp. NPDC055928 TaxID=3345661 RepID=UPI0035DC4C8B